MYSIRNIASHPTIRLDAKYWIKRKEDKMIEQDRTIFFKNVGRWLCEYFKEKPSDVINTCNADGYFNVKASVPMTNEEEYKNAGITEDQAKK